MPLIKDQTYTWRQILKETRADGNPPYYLLHAGTTIVASCLTPDLNPDAPAVILAGDTPQRRRYADLFCAQGGPIPVCVKSADRWLCCGQFKLSGSRDTSSRSNGQHRPRRNPRPLRPLQKDRHLQNPLPELGWFSSRKLTPILTR